MFEYMAVKYIQERVGYKFFMNHQDEGIVVPEMRDIVPVLNHYGAMGWEFICWDSGEMIFKRGQGA